MAHCFILTQWRLYDCPRIWLSFFSFYNVYLPLCVSCPLYVACPLYIAITPSLLEVCNFPGNISSLVSHCFLNYSTHIIKKKPRWHHCKKTYIWEEQMRNPGILVILSCDHNKLVTGAYAVIPFFLTLLIRNFPVSRGLWCVSFLSSKPLLPLTWLPWDLWHPSPDSPRTSFTSYQTLPLPLIPLTGLLYDQTLLWPPKSLFRFLYDLCCFYGTHLWPLLPFTGLLYDLCYHLQESSMT